MLGLLKDLFMEQKLVRLDAKPPAKTLLPMCSRGHGASQLECSNTMKSEITIASANWPDEDCRTYKRSTLELSA